MHCTTQGGLRCEECVLWIQPCIKLVFIFWTIINAYIEAVCGYNDETGLCVVGEPSE